ncbi:MAG: ribbon-helix-helix protein, CopG family [Anaerolineae bacterium]|nr:ribbon-helix-helix protein, CopG family [Anaerolineae bacterium]
MMPRTKNVYTERLTVKITRHMLADLNNVAAKGGDSVSAVVRQSIRNFLDGTDLTLGTRRTFDRRFQQRMVNMEKHLDQKLEQGLAQIAEQVSESLEKDRKQTVYLVRRTVDEALSSFLHGYSQMLDQREAQKKGRGRR